MSKTNKLDLNKTLWNISYIITISFVLFFIVIQLNNRVNSLDDFFLINRLKKFGFWKSIITWHYNQRPVSHFIFNLTFHFNKSIETFKWSLLIFNNLILFLLIHSYKLLINKILSQIKIKLNRSQLLTLSTLIVMSIFFFVFERSEIWFWYICTVIYLLPLSLLNYALININCKDKIKFYSSLVFLILLGGTLEIHIIITSFILIIALYNKFINFKKFTLSIFALFLFSIYQFFNKGIETRINLESTESLYHISTFGSIFSNLLEKKNIFFILILILIISLLAPLIKEIKKDKFIRFFRQYVFFLGLIFCVTLIISKIVFSNSWGLLRMWAPLSIYLMYFIITVSIFIITNYKIRNTIMTKIALINISLYIMFFVFFASKQITLTREYAYKYDRYLKKQWDKNEIIDSGILISPGNYTYLYDFLNPQNNEK